MMNSKAFAVLLLINCGVHGWRLGGANAASANLTHQWRSDGAGRPSSASAPNSNLELARQLNQAFVELAEKVSPSVVVVTVTQKPGGPLSDDAESFLEGLPPEMR